MLIELIVTVILIVAGCFVLISVFELVKSETARALVVVAYGLFTVSLLVFWILTNIA